jgi:hypothetical protein
VAADEFKEQEKDSEIPGHGSPKKKNLMIAGVLVVMLIIAVIAVIVIDQSPSGKGTPQPAVITNSTPLVKGVSFQQTHIVQDTVSQTGAQTIRQTMTLQQTPALPVDFLLQSGDPGSCGLTCRQLDASITNTGYETAHNVCITVGLHNSRNEIIYLNGESSINRCIGDISGGQKKTESISINADCGAFATKCIGETLTLQTRVTSVEKTIWFPDQVIAV